MLHRTFAVVSLLLSIASLGGQEARLSNLAIRAQGGGGDTLITGFTVGPGVNKTVLIRAVGPTLGGFGVAGALSDPKLELFSGTTKVAENDNWSATDASTFASLGAFGLGAGSRDAAIVTTLSPGSYTAQVSGVGSSAGVVLVEVYEVTGGATRLVNLSTRAQVGTGDNILIPGITISGGGSGSRRLLIRAVGPTLGGFGVAGTIADPKLELYSGTAKIAENDNWGTPVGATAADAATLSGVFTQAGAFSLGAGSRDAALLVNLGSGSYTLQVSGVGGTTGAALVEVYDLTPENQTGAKPSATFYLAPLRPDAGASTASGFATLQVNADGTAFVNVTFSNLSAAQSSAHLQIGASTGDFVFNLPAGQVANAFWTFGPTGGFTTNDLINALNTGNLFVSIDSAKYPSGELRGNFAPSNASTTFKAPAAPPALPATALAAPSPADAARFLTQATFGPTLADIDTLTKQGINAWLDQQMAAPASLQLAALRADVAAFPNPPVAPTDTFYKYRSQNRHAAWWKVAIAGPDQLRQRVAFALSQILVVGNDSGIQSESEALCNFYDIFVRHAFGSYRDILDEVTLSPVMGTWLSHLMNQKADPVAGTSPDENYAREVQQLFTIGLVQLHPDGTPILDASGRPIPTYNQSTISETAKVLTGWAWNIPNVSVFTRSPPGSGNVNGGSAANGATPDHPWMVPMRYYDAFHDKTEKRIVSLEQVAPEAAKPTILPANQTGPQDLKGLLDTLFNHPNTGPFVTRQLIQRLVTSNPSPGYVYRVAQVFANDGRGVRGNLGAVIRAILTDYEARSAEVAANVGFGKLKEPLLRVTGLFRGLGAAAANGRYLDSFFGDPRSSSIGLPSGSLASTMNTWGQGPQDALTVFNFYSPDYSPPGPLAAAGLVAPELEITDASYAILVPRELSSYIFRDPTTLQGPPSGPSPFLVMNFTPFLANARNPAALVDQVGLVFAGGQLSAATRAEMMKTLQSFGVTVSDTERVQTAVQLVVLSPDGAVQR